MTYYFSTLSGIREGLWTLLLLLALLCAPVTAETRPPAVAGTFYPSSPQALENIINDLTDSVKQAAIPLPDNKHLRALIMPHAGYPFSGHTAAHASLALKGEKNSYNKVIILGPDHHAGFDGCGISDVKAYQTPLGPIPLHADAALLRRKYDPFITAPSVSETREHSLEVVLPFLQVWLDRFKIIPLITGRTDPGFIAGVLSPLLDDCTLLVASSDLSHFLSYQQALRKDRQTIEQIINLRSGDILKSENSACGKIPIEVIIHLARQYDWEPVFIHYSNSGDSSGNRERVVGYTVIAFYGGQSMANTKITATQGDALVQLARKTILESLGIKTEGPTLDLEQEEALLAHCGTFVTLTIDGNLRGCIGSLTADESVISGVRRNAVNAAFQDPRFPRLTREEADKIDIEVSILSEPRRLEYEDSDDLLAKLCPGVDGVILKKGLSRATFLPQVWKQLPDRTLFMEQLCAKAGLPANTWEQGGMTVYTYQVQSFESNH